MNSNQENLEAEIWRPIPGFKASASSLGRIKSFYKHPEGKIRKLQKGLRAKYVRVQLQLRGPYLSVHRLVALAWHDNPENHPVIRHLDDNGLNNKPDNLKWDTQSNNIALGRKGKYTRIDTVTKGIIKDAYNAGFSKLAIGNYFGLTDTTIRRIVS